MLVGEIISLFRTLIKQRTDDSPYTDQELYLLLNSSANKIKTQVIDKGRKLSTKNWKQFCVKLEKTLFIDCQCIPEELQCQVLKSVDPIPTALVLNNSIAIKVYNIHGDQIGYYTHLKRRQNRRNKVIMSSKSFDIINDYLYIFGDLLSKVVIVEMLIEDVTKLADYPQYDIDGELINNTCHDVTIDEFPLEEQYIADVIDMSFKLMNLSFKLPEDTVENGKV